MRDILTGLAILLIVAITSAMVGPYFVDWSTYRPVFEQKMAESLGVPVALEGPIDVKLLPTPRLTLSAATAGNAGSSPSLSAERVVLEISVMPLLRGEVVVTEARLESPRLEVALGKDGTVEGVAQALAGASRASAVIVDRLVVTDGVVAIADRDNGLATVVTDIAADADAAALAGPWRAGATATIGGRPVEFRLSTGSPEPEGTRIKVTMQSDGGRQRAEVDARWIEADAGAGVGGV